jgi:hypothetical protein
MDPDGNIISRWYVHDILPAMVGIAYNEYDGNLLIYDFHRGDITVMRKDGTVVETFDRKQFGYNYWTTRDIAFNPSNGHIYLTEYQAGVIIEIGPQ